MKRGVSKGSKIEEGHSEERNIDLIKKHKRSGVEKY